MAPDMERCLHLRLSEHLEDAGACATQMLPLTRAAPGGDNARPRAGEPPRSPLVPKAFHVSEGEHDSVLSLMMDSNRTCSALIRDLVAQFKHIVAAGGCDIHENFDIKLDSVLVAQGAQHPMRPDLIASLRLDLARARLHGIVELKSLNAAPDAAFDALDSLDNPQKFILVDVAGKVKIMLQEPARTVGRVVRPRPPTLSTPSPAQHVAATNLADVGGYYFLSDSPGGMWLSVIRHVPVIVWPSDKTILFATSRGHRLHGNAGPDVDPFPSFIFLRAAIDLYILELVPSEPEREPDPEPEPVRSGMSPWGSSSSTYAPRSGS
jgi:hypothetical protein